MLKDDESPLAVGKRLKVLRAMAGLNRYALAEQAEVSKTSISYWEHGKGSPMTARSMRKIISTMEKSGIICSEEWLKTGNGAQPSAIDTDTVKKPLLSSEIQTNLDFFNSSFFEEINLFLSTCTNPQNAVIIKIEHEAMYPFFQKGDIVGGMFVPLHSVDLSKEKICIIKTNGKLDIRRIRTNSSTSRFNLSYLSFDSKCAQAFEINNFPLKTLAPILRLWR